MRLVPWPKVAPETFQNVHDSLEKIYGPQTRIIRGPITYSVLDSVVSTVLSQNTNDRNSGRAYKNIKQAYPTWEECRVADVDDIKETIKSGGLATIKAARIKGILEQVHQTYGKTDLEFLREKSTEEVKETLQKYKGLGPKTISCVLMFNLQREDFPVDTHVHRVSKRLGWVPEKASREATYNFLNAEIPAHLRYPLHILLIRHGKQICKSRNPKCSTCPLNSICPVGQSLLDVKKQKVDEAEESEDEESEEVEEKPKVRAWSQRRKKPELEDIEDIVVKKEGHDSDTELMFVCGVNIHVKKPVKKRKSV